MSIVENTKQNVEEILLGLLEKGISALEKGGEFLGEQIPLVVQELLLFKGVWAGVLVLFSVMLITIGWFVFKKGSSIFANYRQAKSDWHGSGGYISKKEQAAKYPILRFYSDGDPMMPDIIVVAYISSFIFVGVGVIGFFVHVHNLLMITLAPRLYLLEYASSLVR